MRKKTLLTGLCLISLTALSLSPSRGHAKEYFYDHRDSRITFTLKHLGVVTVEGQFLDFAGSFEFDPENIEDSVVSLVIQTKSLYSGIALRDSQLKQRGYFWADKYPEITFTSRAFGDIRNNTFNIYGDLTIRGKTLPAVFETELLDSGKELLHSEEKRPLHFRSEAYINRKDYGIGTVRWHDPFTFITAETLKISLEVHGFQKAGPAALEPAETSSASPDISASASATLSA